MDEDTLRSIAATQHLVHYGFMPATVPEWYLAELKKHAAAFKNDLNFRVYFTPGGYGRILCLEKGCQKYVELGPFQGPTVFLNDGRSVGFGGFLQYQIHAEGEHRKSRIPLPEALQQMQVGTVKSRVPSGGVLAALASANVVPSVTLQTQGKSKVDSKRLTIGGPAFRSSPGQDASDKVVGHKRPSSTAEELFGPRPSVVVSQPPVLHASKKIKPSPPAPVPVQSTVLNPMHNNSYPQHEPNKSLSRAQPRASYPGTFTAKQESLSHNSELQPLIHDKPMPRVKPRVSLPASLTVGENVSPTLAYGMPYIAPPSSHITNSSDAAETATEMFSQSSEVYDSDGDDNVAWKRYEPKPKMNLNDVLLELAGSTFDENATIDEALKKLGLPDTLSRLAGMSSILLPHQILGVAWMREREAHTDRGGILADEMGLGNVQTIALLTQNRSDDPAVKTTLIVAPTALLLQWKSEFELHTDGDPLRILIYHGAAKKKHTTKKSLQKYDVVITTYATVALEKPSYDELFKKRKKKDDFIASDSEDFDKRTKKDGPLINFPWYRIILDEAQMIRNHRTRASQVVCELRAEHRWCLTGTPIINTLQDAYALFSFLGIRPWNDWTDFRDHILKGQLDPQISSMRLQMIFRKCLLRRRKDSTLDGEPLITLPPKTQEDIELDFSPEERQTYDAVSARAQAVFNRYLRAGTVLKNYSHVFAMLLRLRQICVHPCLIAENMDVFRTPDEIEGVKERERLNEVIGRARREQGQLFVDKLLALQKAKLDARIAAEKESPDAKIEEDPCPVCREPLMTNTAHALACCHALCEDCLDRIMETPYVTDNNDAEKYMHYQRPCPACRAPISKQHSYLQVAFDPVIPIEVSDSDEDVKPTISSKRAEPPITRDKPVKEENDPEGSPKIKALGRRVSIHRNAKKRAIKLPDPDSDPDSDSDDSLDDFIVHTDSDEEEKDRIKTAKAKGLKVNRVRPRKAKYEDDDELESDDTESDDDDEDDKKRIFAREEILKKPMAKPLASFLPSTKMLRMMEMLKEWREKAPNDKCLIVSQWTSVLELCSAYLWENDFDHLSFIGKMTLRQRDDAVNRFKNERNIKVMLISMKAGGVGLNLTAANRVILLDLGWSPAVENQAFDRVHRLGQQLDVEIYRLVIRETVEARVLTLQRRKQGLMDGSLGEGSVRRRGRLSVRELASLFGINI